MQKPENDTGLLASLSFLKQPRNCVPESKVPATFCDNNKYRKVSVDNNQFEYL